MQLKMAANIFVYLYDGLGGRAFNHHSLVGTMGGAFVNENCPLSREFDNFFQIPDEFCPRVCPGDARG